MSGDTPLAQTVSKKRELTSPDIELDLKKNRQSGSQSDAEISDLSVMDESHHMDTQSGVGVDVDDSATQVTLSESHIQKMASCLEASFQPQIAQIIRDSFQTQITDMVSSIVKGVLDGLQIKIAALEQENTTLKTKIDKLELALDTSEQYSRRNCLRISGVPETNTCTDDYVCELANAVGVDLKIEDIDRSHRLGKPMSAATNQTKPRDIVVKFVSYRTRAQFYKARVQTKTKGYKGIFVNEHLTKARATLLFEARRRVKSKQLASAWSMDGTVMIKLTDADPSTNFGGTVRRVTSLNDLPNYVPLPVR